MTKQGKNPYQQVAEFHEVFAPRKVEKPSPFSVKKASDRVDFKAEELVEFLYGVANNDHELFKELLVKLKASIDKAESKVLNKQKIVSDPLVEEVDALVDLLYFTYGSFYLLGVDPTKLFSIVHEANMGKLFPDGKPHYDPVTNKVLKPDDWEERFAPEPKIKEELLRQIKEAESQKN